MVDVCVQMDKEQPKKDVELSFINEVEIISRASHKNLAQCLGFCVETGDTLMLALRFYPNGSVANRTRGMRHTQTLYCTVRLCAVL